MMVIKELLKFWRVENKEGMKYTRNKREKADNYADAL